MSIIYNKNNRGPKTEPCRTTHVIITSTESIELTDVNSFLLFT
jgi:hypothetical protein